MNKLPLLLIGSLLLVGCSSDLHCAQQICSGYGWSAWDGVQWCYTDYEFKKTKCDLYNTQLELSKGGWCRSTPTGEECTKKYEKQEHNGDTILVPIYE